MSRFRRLCWAEIVFSQFWPVDCHFRTSLLLPSLLWSHPLDMLLWSCWWGVLLWSCWWGVFLWSCCWGVLLWSCWWGVLLWSCWGGVLLWSCWGGMLLWSCWGMLLFFIVSSPKMVRFSTVCSVWFLTGLSQSAWSINHLILMFPVFVPVSSGFLL